MKKGIFCLHETGRQVQDISSILKKKFGNCYNATEHMELTNMMQKYISNLNSSSSGDSLSASAIALNIKEVYTPNTSIAVCCNSYSCYNKMIEINQL